MICRICQDDKLAREFGNGTICEDCLVGNLIEPKAYLTTGKHAGKKPRKTRPERTRDVHEEEIQQGGIDPSDSENDD